MSSRQISRLSQRKPCGKILKGSIRNKLDESAIEISNKKSIWCHLCQCNFSNHDEFRMHIMKKHRPSSQFYEGNSDTDDSEQVEDLATNFQGSQENDLKCKIETYSDEDSDENEEKSDFNGRDNIYEQRLYNNISETAVSPQSLLSHRKSTSMKNSSKTKFSLLKVKKEKEELPSAGFNSGTTNAISSSANQFIPFSFATNQISPQLNPMLNNPQFILNNQLQLINPYNQQSSYLMGNQPALQFNPVVINPVPTSQNEFVFNAKNIINWNYKLKKMTKPLKYPLKQKLLKKIKSVHEDIYHNCHFLGVQTDKEKTILLKIYHDLELMICKHNEFVHEQL